MTDSPMAGWSDLHKALFLLDGACQSIMDEWHGKPDPAAIALLAKHKTRIEYLRREYAVAWIAARKSSDEMGPHNDARGSDDG